MLGGVSLPNFDVSRETVETLKEYSFMLAKWSRKINLIAPSTVENLWQRHIIDSAQLCSAIRFEEVDVWCDLGSGGGLPGLVVAIIFKEKLPDIQVKLLEADGRKAAFLKTAIQEFGLNAVAVQERIEDAPAAHADVVSARALAPLKGLLGFSQRHGLPESVSLFPKGRMYASEIQEARRFWEFDLEILASATDQESRILKIRNIAPKDRG